jgi:hypothetical protein
MDIANMEVITASKDMGISILKLPLIFNFPFYFFFYLYFVIFRHGHSQHGGHHQQQHGHHRNQGYRRY